MQDVLDPLFLPAVGDAGDLFAIQNQFMMTVLGSHQRIGTALHWRRINAEKVNIGYAYDLDQYPIPANYSGAMLFDLLTRWETWVYEWGIEGTPVSSTEKPKLLERYVANVEGFRNVVSNSLMLAAVSTTVMSADTKIILYRTQASVLDNAQKNFARKRRSALVHELMTIRQIRDAHAAEGY
eukprot:scaffold726_cov103-Skeletonema_marinoi.AAC.1